MRWIGRVWRAVVVGAALTGALAACTSNAGKGHAAPPAAKLNSTQVQAAMKMAAAAQKAYEGLADMDGSRARSPQVLDVKVQWSRNWLSAELLLHPAGTEAERAIRSHVDRMNTLLRATQDRVGSEPGAADAVPAAEYALADGEYDLAALNSTGAMNGAMAAAAERMVSDAKRAALGAEGAARGGVIPPELFELQMLWSRRQVRAEALIEPMAVRRLPLLQGHWDRINRLARQARADRNADPALTLQAEYGLAEADFMLEMNAGNEGTMTREQTASAQHLADSARAVWGRLNDEKATRPRVPEFMNLLLLYSRRWVEAEMRLYPTGAERHHVVDDYVKRSMDFYTEAQQRPLPEGPGVLSAMGAYAVAEGEYWGAGGP